MKYILSLAILFAFSNSFAFKSGTLTCYFDLVTTAHPGSYEKTAPFTFDITKAGFQEVSSPTLGGLLYVAYHPGYSNPNKADIDLFVVSLTYGQAHAGADVPAINDRVYTFKIARDFTDLVAGFLNCHSDVK